MKCYLFHTSPHVGDWHNFIILNLSDKPVKCSWAPSVCGVLSCFDIYWASEASSTLGCSNEISRDIYVSSVGMSVVYQIA